jgi:hypothetical protein
MARLADVATILSGLNPEPARYGPCKFVQIRDLTRARRALVAGERPTAARALPVAPTDVLVAARGEQNLAVRPDDELVGAFAALDVYLIKPDLARLDPDYLAAFLARSDIGAQLRSSTAGASLPRIPKNALAELALPLPDLDRQRAIGGLSLSVKRYGALCDRLRAAENRIFERHLDRAFARLQ